MHHPSTSIETQLRMRTHPIRHRLQTRRNNLPISDKSGYIEFVDGDFSTFTGNFIVQEGITLGFNFNIPDGTFGLTVEDSGGRYHERYELVNNVTVTSLTLGTESIDPGPYTFDDFTKEQQVFFKDSGGTITVTPVPEPSACMLCLMSLAGLALARTRGRK